MIKKKATDKKKRGEYEEPLKVNGSFMDIMNATIKHREKNIPAKKKP
jgi:hypothetical protein